LKLQKEKIHTHAETQPESSSNNLYVQAQTGQKLQLSATKEEIPILPTKMANEKRNSLNQYYTTGKIENNNSNLLQKTNTSSSDSKLSEPEGETVTADIQKNKKRKNKKGIHKNDIVITEATIFGQGFSSH
ncbi:2326_t:CDS:1, partial [Scutellospora calospora]